tara:strand:+ start:53 stop:2080 length:2028 start_codon:yes stop_codon:yes gene_type:complete
MAGDVIKMVLQVDDKASGPVKKVGGATEKAGKQAKKAQTDYAQLAGKIVAFGLAAKAGLGAVKALTQGLADSRNELADTATRTGITAHTLAGLRLAAEGSGLSLGNLSGSLALFPKRMRDMQAGIGESKRAFEELGVSVMNADGSLRDADTVLKEALAAISLLPDATTQAAVATELFGRSGTALLQALSGTELEDFIDQADKFGIDIGPNAAKAAADWQREIAQMSMVSERSAGLIAEAFGLNGAGGVLKGLGAAMLTLSTLFRGVMDNMRDVFGVFMERMQIQFSFLLNLLGAAKQALGGDFAGAADTAGQAMDQMGRRFDALAVTSEKVFKDLLGGSVMADALKAGREFLDTETAGAGAGRASVSAAMTVTPQESPEKAAEKAKKPEKGEKLPTAEEIEAAMRASLEGTAASLKELEHVLYLLSPAGLAEGMVNKLSNSFGTMTAMMGPAGGLVSGLSELGKAGAGQITKALKESINGVIVALVEVLPDLIVEIPRLLIDAIPDLIAGIVSAIPALLEALIVRLPEAIAMGLFNWWKVVWRTIKETLGKDFFKKGDKGRQARGEFAVKASKFLSNLVGPGGFFRGKKHAGTSHIDRTGMALVQAGEQIVPSSGTTTQGMDRRMGRGGGVNVTINTNVVDKNAIRGLGKLLEQEFSSFGRSTSPLFNSPTGTTG